MNEFKDYIDSIINDIAIDSKSKKDIADEIDDHLKLSKQEYINKGYSQKEAIGMAIKSFGEVKKIKSKYTQNFNPFYKIIRILATILFIPYMLLFIKFSFFSFFSHLSLFSHLGKYNSINLIPLKSISHYLFNYPSFNFSTWFSNLFGMVIAFIPFGFLIPIMYNRIKRIRDVIIASILLSMLTEVLQHITKRGVADIDDIILSTIGSILGYILLKLIMKFMLRLKKAALNIKIVETDNQVIYKE